MPIEIRELVIKATVITVSDACSRGERKDTSGEVLVQLLRDLGAEIVATQILSDDLDPLAEALRKYADRLTSISLYSAAQASRHATTHPRPHSK